MKILMTVTLVVCSIAVCSRSAADDAMRVASRRSGDGDLYVAGWRRLEPPGTSRLPTSATTIASGTP